MTADPRIEEVAREIRRTHLLNVSLAAKAGRDGDLKEACDLAEEAITAALTSERKREREACARTAEECDTLGLDYYGDNELTSEGMAARNKVRQIAKAIRARKP